MAEQGELSESELRAAHAKEYFDYLCESDFREIHERYEFEEEVIKLRSQIASIQSMNMQITSTIFMLRSHVSLLRGLDATVRWGESESQQKGIRSSIGDDVKIKRECITGPAAYEIFKRWAGRIESEAQAEGRRHGVGGSRTNKT